MGAEPPPSGPPLAARFAFLFASRTRPPARQRTFQEEPGHDGQGERDHDRHDNAYDIVPVRVEIPYRNKHGQMPQIECVRDDSQCHEGLEFQHSPTRPSTIRESRE